MKIRFRRLSLPLQACIALSCMLPPAWFFHDLYRKGVIYGAVGQGNVDEVRALLDRGMDPNEKEWQGLLPLVQATSDGHEDVVRLLLMRGADPNKAMRIAIIKERVHILKMLIACGANVNRKYAGEVSLLRMAKGSASPQIVQVLEKAGAQE